MLAALLTAHTTSAMFTAPVVFSKAKLTLLALKLATTL